MLLLLLLLRPVSHESIVGGRVVLTEELDALELLAEPLHSLECRWACGNGVLGKGRPGQLPLAWREGRLWCNGLGLLWGERGSHAVAGSGNGKPNTLTHVEEEAAEKGEGEEEGYGEDEDGGDGAREGVVENLTIVGRHVYIGRDLV